MCRLYQCNVCGEGGEYESLVLDCPMFKHARIVLDKWDIVLQSPDSFAPVGLLHAVAFHLESKGQHGAHHTQPKGHSHAASPESNDSSQMPDANNSLLHPTEPVARGQNLAADPQDDAHVAPHSVTPQVAVDKLLAASTVIEVPTDIILSPNNMSYNDHADGHLSQCNAADWQTHVQLQHGADYSRAVCCPQQLIDSPPSGEATAAALHAALLAVSKGIHQTAQYLMPVWMKRSCSMSATIVVYLVCSVTQLLSHSVLMA